MKMNTYVNFSGSCAEAFRYYEKHLGAKVGTLMTHGQSPDQSRVKPPCYYAKDLPHIEALMHGSRRLSRILSNDTAALWLLGLAFTVLHLAMGVRYGFHRDELLTYSN